MTKNATQQWLVLFDFANLIYRDFPLSWPPLNHMIVEGFRKSSNPWLQNKAIELAQKWIDNNFRVFNQTRLMFEKVGDLLGKMM
jgi:alpha,alpha-trehalase